MFHFSSVGWVIHPSIVPVIIPRTCRAI
uniref:Uncharacterized protein n=1 Tax=Rhizophora mucronata TaxID=61149 RepID=A0A2P2MCT9_RHIMU